MDFEFVILLIDEGILGLGNDNGEGMRVVYYMDNVEFTKELEQDEYQVIGRFEQLDNY
jgi:hypothetical protein